MLKRVMILVCCIYVLFLSVTAQALKLEYPQYYNGNHNIPLIWGHMDTGWFLDRTSIVCEEYNPPCYTLAANVIVVNNANQGNTDIYKVHTIRLFYNYNDLKMYVDRNPNASDWRYLKPTGSNAESGMPMYMGEAMFYVSYGKRFYGSRKWYNSFLKKHIEVFSDKFYEKLQ